MYLNKRKLVILFHYLYCKLLNSHVHVNYEAVFTMKLWHEITNLLAVFIIQMTKTTTKINSCHAAFIHAKLQSFQLFELI